MINNITFEDAIDTCNFDKGLGPDGFDGNALLLNKELRHKVSNELLQMLCDGSFPTYFLNGRLVPLSKTASQTVELNDIRPIVIKPHLVKICEKAVQSKIKELGSRLLDTDGYQTGFKEKRSTHNNLMAVLSRLKSQNRKRSQRGIAVFIDLQKAYDSVPRDRMILNLWKEAGNEQERILVSIIANLHLF